MTLRTILLKPFLVLLLMLLPLAWLHAEETMVQLDDGSSVKVFVFYPKDQDEGKAWPLCVLMPGGTANEYVARAQFWLGRELARRGWAIAVPVSPDATPFFGSNAEKIPKVIAELQKSPYILNGKTLLVGVSNGGSSALEIASRHPENYLGVVAVPGIHKSREPLVDMQGLPVFIRIGARDPFRWHRQLPSLVEKLTRANARVDASVVPGAQHVFPINWAELQPWLDSLESQ